jgi:hypothetical protein
MGYAHFLGYRPHFLIHLRVLKSLMGGGIASAGVLPTESRIRESNVTCRGAARACSSGIQLFLGALACGSAFGAQKVVWAL